jgi:tRNA (guanine-N7-)-methyltransferase
MSIPTRKPRTFRRGAVTIPKAWEDLSVPWGPSVIAEVGCGVGEWACHEAAQHPDTHYIAIEKTKLRSDALLARAKSAGLSNLTAVRADGILFLDVMCPPASLDAIYFFYPNPWPKKMHAQRRLLIGPSMWVFDRCLKPGGQIYLATNIERYAEEAAAILRDAWEYRIVAHGPIAPHIAPRTAFERKYLKRNETLYELNAKKPTDDDDYLRCAF